MTTYKMSIFDRPEAEKVIWKGKEYLLFSPDGDGSSVMATKKQFRDLKGCVGVVLQDDIWFQKKIIGKKQEIAFTGERYEIGTRGEVPKLKVKSYEPYNRRRFTCGFGLIALVLAIVILLISVGI